MGEITMNEMNCKLTEKMAAGELLYGTVDSGDLELLMKYIN